ncbi:MAG: replicative DNA helicase [Anaerolineae bacterium]|jgi:replicative DNA helicase
MTNSDRLAPANVDAERAVLGALLIDSSAIVRVAATLAPDDFSRPAHATIYRAAIELFQRHEAIDYVTVVTHLERQERIDEAGGSAYLAELIEGTPYAIHVEHYAGLVSRAAIQRRLLEAAQNIARIAYDDQAETIEETVDKAEAELFRVLGDRQRRDLLPLSDLLDVYLDKIEDIQANRERVSGVRTGFAQLDELLGGLQGSDLCIIAGRPGMGKTSWLTSVALNVAVDAGATVALFSLEMSAEQLVQRFLSMETEISTHDLRLGRVRQDELELVTRAIGRLAEARIYIDDSPGVNPFDIRTKVRRLHAEKGVDLVVVDYLQLMHGGRPAENRVQEISFISRSLKGLAREVNVPIIAASQLSRAVENRSDKRPQLSDLRESGSIEQDADMVIFLYRDSVYNGTSDFEDLAEVHLAKHRHGPTDKVKLVFVPAQTRFVDPGVDARYYGE